MNEATNPTPSNTQNTIGGEDPSNGNQSFVKKMKKRAGIGHTTANFQYHISSWQGGMVILLKKSKGISMMM